MRLHVDTCTNLRDLETIYMYMYHKNSAPKCVRHIQITVGAIFPISVIVCTIIRTIITAMPNGTYIRVAM